MRFVALCELKTCRGENPKRRAGRIEAYCPVSLECSHKGTKTQRLHVVRLAAFLPVGQVTRSEFDRRENNRGYSSDGWWLL